MLKINFIKKAVVIALGAVYANEYRLIKQHCHELNIVGTFYYYFRLLFEANFSPYVIDMEYCRIGEGLGSKEISIQDGEDECPLCHKEHKRRIRSDFIVHKPGFQDNLLALEFKGVWSRRCLDWDYRKLAEMTKPLGVESLERSWVCGYKRGGSILLDEDRIEIQWFSKGAVMNRKDLFNVVGLVEEYKKYMETVGL